jgi:coproporphyrinogen III oxidase-like Fe-S oxidoreductase
VNSGIILLMRPLLPQILRLLVSGKTGPFVFEPQPVVLPSKPSSINLYVHLPFCRQLCPFCPYVKEVYDPETSTAYQRAIIKELESYRGLWGEVNVESVYFGGGTPTLTPEIVIETLDWLKRNFRLGGEVGVEVHPLNASHSLLESFKQSGVSLVSLGVQSFNDRLLKVLGRDYDRQLAKEACRRALETGFATTDIDLIFAIPTQTREEVRADISYAGELGVEQISAYPLISFSYLPFKRQMDRAKIALPGWREEREMLKLAVKTAADAGYRRTSVWSFGKPQAPHYTTVTKESFVGIGVSATTMMGDYFAVNTFSVPEYIRTADKGRRPAIATRLDTRDRMAYWLFWRAYDLAIDTDRLKTVFNRSLPLHIRGLLSLFSRLGAAKHEGDTFYLTERGAYLFHLIEKEYTHAYLERLWGACLKEAWPRRVVI